jgi:peroxiredoxin
LANATAQPTQIAATPQDLATAVRASVTATRALLTPSPLTPTRAVAATPIGTPAPVIGAQAPNFSIKSMDGKRVSLSDYNGTPALLFFLATWCPYCQQEAPAIQSVYQTYKNRGITVIPVVTGIRTPATLDADIKAFMSKAGWTDFSPLIDSDGAILSLYNQTGFPANFFMDKNGVIRVVTIGAMDAPSIENAVKQIISVP